MSTPPPHLASDPAPGHDAVDPAAVQGVSAWVNQLGRTLKTCRLYDGANPVVARFREELASALSVLLVRHGALSLQVRSSALLYAGHEVHSTASRDDQIAGVLHRDGIRQITFEPGIDAAELDSLVDQILVVTGPSAGDDDLVTLLWDANLLHVLLETVPLEGEADGGAGAVDVRSRVFAFPRQQVGEAAPAQEDGEPASDLPRSEDWTTGEDAVPIEQSYERLYATASHETARFRQECEAMLAESHVTTALRVIEDCFASELCPSDRQELLDFLPRVLREALSLGDWSAARAALRLLRQAEPEWSLVAFAEELCGPLALTTRRVVASLDRQDAQGMQEFLELARQFGTPMAEWLMRVLAESEQMRVRRPLARTLAELLADRPEQLSPWATDERWYVVRNVVHILGWIGGDRIVSALEGVAEHPEPRVRREVVAALSGVDPGRSRPILQRMLRDAEPKLFGTILHQLGTDEHPSIAELMLGLFRDEGFVARSEEERRALFIALATRGDAVVPILETALLDSGKFARHSEPARPAIALCLARIGTPAALAVLVRGLHSRNAAVRKACQIATPTREVRHD